MTDFVLWGLGTIIGFFGGILCTLIFDIYTERKYKQQEDKEYKQAKKDFLNTQTERMKQKAKEYESKQNK